MAAGGALTRAAGYLSIGCAMPQPGPDSVSSVAAAGKKNTSESLAAVGVSVLIAYASVRSFFAAASKPFWYDELLTVILTGQSSLSAVWRALSQAVDGQPIGFYLIERAAHALTRDPHIAFRIPSIFAFACALLCVFLFVKRRSGALYALLCTSMLLLTVVYSTYAVEARPYGLLLACIAFALLCYQRAPEPLWLVLLGLSLASAESLHYYAVFALFPLGLAEIALSIQTRRLRPAVWLALAAAFLPLVGFWPLLLRLKRYYGPHIWDPPTLRHVGGTYGWLLNMPSRVHPEIAAAVVLVLLCVLAALVFRSVRAACMASPFFHEHVLVWALLALPFAAFVATKIAHGGFDHKYVLPAVLGIPLGAGYVLGRLRRSVVVLLAVLVVSILAVQEARFWVAQRGHLGEVVSPVASLENSVDLAGHTNLPVVVSDTLDYLTFVYYASPSLAGRLVAVVDPPEEVAYAGTDSLDRNLARLRLFYPLRVYGFQAFASDHPRFLLYSDGSINDWWPRRLGDDGYSLEVVAAEGGRKVYLVSGGR